MKTSVQLLDELKRAKALKSDYQLAKFLDEPLSRISKYRNAHVTIGDELALRLAALLEIEPGQVLLWLQIERAERAERYDVVRALRSAARVRAKAAMLAGAAVTMALLPPSADAFDNNRISDRSQASSATRPEYTLCDKRRRRTWRELLAWLFARS